MALHPLVLSRQGNMLAYLLPMPRPCSAYNRLISRGKCPANSVPILYLFCTYSGAGKVNR